ncbi:hypothetical protein KQ693_05760 [Thermus sp. PS18]|uniref:hypothetical protein n=1 Tax=Thermus sp. PS18 TaxID=2849039 RepID=UPI002264D698|nr:hypothetical protein [Thermus sp. PS18]UZX16535.1 hypothetical protein KQ693_05760 [Thermus sp. PS18]
MVNAMAHRALYDPEPHEWRYRAFAPVAVRWARLALEAEGYEVESHAALLEEGILLAAWHPERGEGYLLDPYEVHLVARYGPEAIRKGLLRGYVRDHAREEEPGYHIRRYAEAALARIVAEFQREATPGNRNNALNRMAYALGRLVGGGLISEDEAREVIFGEAQAVFSASERSEVEATARSGLEAGKKRPAQKPERAIGLRPRKGVVPPWAK